MNAGSFIGYKCPKCNTTIDIGVVAGSDELKCPSCKTIMEPNPRGKAIAANVYCPNCNASFGLINSDKCPRCGGSFSSL
jgi:DnaJ-class molecular chaperone